MKTLLKRSCLLVWVVLTVSYGYAQTTSSPLIGRWLTKDRTTIQFSPCGAGACGQQIAAERETDRQANGKVIAQDVILEKDRSFTGLVFDPGSGKSYKASWLLSTDGKTLTLRVKWGLMSFNEDWKRVN